MTGFATVEATVDDLNISWELKSVNHRFLDVSFRLPDEVRALEPAFRNRITGSIKRGKVDCSLKFSLPNRNAIETELDTEVVAHLRELEARLLAEQPDAKPLSVAEVLRWPGVVRERSQEYPGLEQEVIGSFSAAVDLLAESRAGEGGTIASVLEQRLGAIRELLKKIAPGLENAAAKYRDKLLERLERLDVEVDAERIEQELAVIAQRVDVAEEFDRLRGHVTEVESVLSRDEPIGRRLDFLMQELNREANTLASKAQDEELARRAVDLKVLIEQMREQVQNLE